MSQQSDDLLNQIKQENDEWRKMTEETAVIERFHTRDADGAAIATQKITRITATGTESRTVILTIPPQSEKRKQYLREMSERRKQLLREKRFEI